MYCAQKHKEGILSRRQYLGGLQVDVVVANLEVHAERGHERDKVPETKKGFLK